MKLQGRIYELSKEAGFTGKYDFPYGENLNPAIQKFAELIVRECVAICENNEYPENPDLFEEGWDGGLQNAQERMVNHFDIDAPGFTNFKEQP
jgi:hypothetical protein